MNQKRAPEIASVVAAGEQVSCALGAEVVALALKGGVYYRLNTVAASIWALIQTPRSMAEIRRSVLEEYDVEPATCDRDLAMLLQALKAAGLVEVTYSDLAEAS